MPQGHERPFRHTADARLIARLRQARAKGTGASYCVVGAGHGGLAMAGHLGILGYAVNIYNRTDEKLDGVRWHGGVKVGGAVTGFGPVRTGGVRYELTARLQFVSPERPLTLSAAPPAEGRGPGSNP